MKAIVNGKIILKDRIEEGKALLYSNVIEGIVPTDRIPADCEIIDAKGGYVSPICSCKWHPEYILGTAFHQTELPN